MPRELSDVFQYIDMRGGDTEQCWPYVGSYSDKKLPYFAYERKKLIAYRVVYELTHGPIPPGHVVRHKCDSQGCPGFTCCNPAHLETGTHQQNMDDMKERERHGLTHYVVRNIKRLLARGDGGEATHKAIAELYGISRESVSAIAQGRTYKDISVDDPV